MTGYQSKLDHASYLKCKWVISCCCLALCFHEYAMTSKCKLYLLFNGQLRNGLYLDTSSNQAY